MEGLARLSRLWPGRWTEKHLSSQGRQEVGKTSLGVLRFYRGSVVCLQPSEWGSTAGGSLRRCPSVHRRQNTALLELQQGDQLHSRKEAQYLTPMQQKCL